MNRGIISIFVAGTIILTACLSSPRTASTKTPVVAAPADATQAPVETESAPTPAPADMTAAAPAEDATATVTNTEELTPTGEVVPTEEITPTVEVTPTEQTTETESGFVVEQTDIKTVTARVTINVRSGPGFQYAVISRVRARRSATVTGVSPDYRWYRIECADETDTNCWVTADKRYVTVSE